MDVLKRIKSGDKVMVILSSRGGGLKYSLTDGTEVTDRQFREIMDFLEPCDAGLFGDENPQSYKWHSE